MNPQNIDRTALITEGRWAGFTHDEAMEWREALFLYEPQGFISPNLQVRMKAQYEMHKGILPEVFGYPERARKLTDGGLPVKRYLEVRELLGSKKFDPADIRFSVSPSTRNDLS